MNGIQRNGKNQRCDKSVPGCLGRMVNLFDLTSTIPGNRLLTDKPHNYGSSVSTSRSDVSGMSSIPGEEIQDKVMISESRRSSSSRKPHGTPVKMLMAQEMSKDLGSGHNSPNVVARLMGLDTLPQQLPELASQRCHSHSLSRDNSGKPIGDWRGKHGFPNIHIDCEVPLHQGPSEYKDVYEEWQRSQRTNCVRESPLKGRCNENVNEKLSLIRQKFMEAKWLATDEELRQTKEFQDALDVLSSDGDLFLKVLPEPNSLYSQPLYNAQPFPPSPETKRITVLRPSKMMVDHVDNKFAAPVCTNEKLRKKHNQVNQGNLWDNQHGFSPTMSTWQADDSPTQPTRIVVLKPSLAKVNDVKVDISVTSPSPRTLQGEIFYERPEDETREPREKAKEITRQMRENLTGHRREETLFSSVSSNGYAGDESSFDKYDNEFAAGNLSDSEVMSLPSRHYWDYVNRYSSPYSSSSFSRAFFSPESLVCREAKKRLSERWSTMISNRDSQEQRHFRRNSSTLGEMLTFSEIKKPKICEEEDNIRDQLPRQSISCLNSNLGAKESGDVSPRSLLRSKSLPVSSAAHRDRLNVKVSDPVLGKEDGSKEIIKTKNSKRSFTDKVTSLLFAKNRKSSKEKSLQPPSNENFHLAGAEILGTSVDHSDIIFYHTSQVQSGINMGVRIDKTVGLGVCSQQGGFCASQLATFGIQGENQDQPSPISVLDPPFKEDDAMLGDSHEIEPNSYWKQMPISLGKSNLLDKSPPIGSIARTLSWNESRAETATRYPLNSPFVSPRTEDDEGELIFLVQSLLSMAGLDDMGQLTTSLTRWHSPKSPLDPLLRDKYVDVTSKEPVHEAKRRQLRSNRKLVFDCVNAALLDITRIGTPSGQWDEGLGGALVDKVWARMKEWFVGQVKTLSLDGGDSESVLETVVRKEVAGRGWVEHLRFEAKNIGKQIEGKLLDELVEESLIEWTGRD